MTDRVDINLIGKDFFTREEAAHYACVSLAQFLEEAPKHGIFPMRWMGKTVYRKADIQRAMEGEWQRSAFAKTGTGRPAGTSSTGRMRPADATDLSLAKSVS